MSALTPTPASSSTTAPPQMKWLTPTIQKDIRSLTNNDNFREKKNALLNLTGTLFGADKVDGQPASSDTEACIIGSTQSNAEEIVTFFETMIMKPLLKLFIDCKEKIRELSLLLAIKFIQSPQLELYDVRGFMNLYIPVFKRAFANASPNPFEETAEEIRLLIVKLMTAIISHPSITGEDSSVIGDRNFELTSQPSTSSSSSGLIAVNGELTSTLARALSDTYPSIKRECCLLIAKAFKKLPASIRLNASTLMRPLIVNLGHQHSKTRQMTVKALGMVLVSDGGPDDVQALMVDVVLPAFKKVSFDNIASVRKALLSALSRLLCVALTLDDDVKSVYKPFTPSLLCLMLALACDETPDVAEVAMEEIDVAATVWSENNGGVSGGVVNMDVVNDDDEDEDDGDTLIRSFVSHHFTDILKPLLNDANHWTTNYRLQSIQTLTRTITLTANQSNSNIITSHVEEILTMLSSSIRDDEPSVHIATVTCAEVLGESIRASDALNVVLPRIDGTVSGMSTPEKLSGSLLILNSIMTGANRVEVNECVLQITNALSSASILDSGERGVMDGLLLCCQTLISRCLTSSALTATENSSVLAANPKARLNLLRVIIQLLGCDLNFDLSSASISLLESVRKSCNAPSISELFDGEFEALVHMLSSDSVGAGEEDDDVKVWVCGSSSLKAFDALLRHSGSCPGIYFAAVINIFEVHMSIDNDPTTRLTIMALLEATLSQPSVCKYITQQPLVYKLISDIIAPNIIWKAGNVASTIRKISIACLYTILRPITNNTSTSTNTSGLVSTEILFKTAPLLLPILKTNLSEYDATSRQLVVCCLGIIFTALPGAFGSDVIHQLYPDLLKCLDDSSDDVRFAALTTLKSFLRCSQKEHFTGTLIDYLVTQLYIHLDDPDGAVQRGVYEVLVVAVAVDVGVVKKKGVEAGRSCRDKRWVEALLDKC